MQKPSITELLQFYRAHQIVDEESAPAALRRLLKRWDNQMLDTIYEQLGLAFSAYADQQAKVEAITEAIRLRCSRREEH